MAIRLNIPEANTLRRLAASLATSLSSSAIFKGTLDESLSAGLFFRSFPWTGQLRKAGALPEVNSSTVGQYFKAFNWEGIPVSAAEDVEKPEFVTPVAARIPKLGPPAGRVFKA